MIYLRPEYTPLQLAADPFLSRLQDDNFWHWFRRTFPSSFDVPQELEPGDFLLQYAMLGPPKEKGGTHVALLWELYPEMRAAFGHTHDDAKIEAMYRCHEKADLSFVQNTAQLAYFPEATVLPIGIDTELFRPTSGLRSGAIWVGTEHPMKGLDLARAWQQETGEYTRFVLKGDMTQVELADAMRHSKYVLLAGRLAPLYLADWEALASDCIPVEVGVERSPQIWHREPRRQVFDLGWDRRSVESRWRQILEL